MNFASDNVGGAHPAILAALAEAAASGPAAAYGADPYSAALAARLGALFEHAVAVFPVATGTAANALALAALTPPWGGVLCHAHAHIQDDECGAVEALSGARLLPVPGADGKLTPALLAARLATMRRGDQHQVQPAAISLSQATECGTLYRPAEVAALGAFARDQGLRLHMDGARFANAVARLGCAPAALTWQAGVDVLSLGATKNGALAAEAVLFFDRDLARDFSYRRKRAGHLLSKMRFLSAQLLAYLDHDLWLVNAQRANGLADRLAAGLAAVPGLALAHPVEANEVFVEMPAALAERLLGAGAQFYPWGPTAADGRGCYRLVTGFDTPETAVRQFIALARGTAESA